MGIEIREEHTPHFNLVICHTHLIEYLTKLL